MDYHYNRLLIVLNWLGAYVFIALILVLLTFARNESLAQNLRYFVIGFVFVLFFSIYYSKEYYQRRVVFEDAEVVFHSFRIAREVRTIHVKYEDILSIKAKPLPAPGVLSISVKAKNVPWEIPVSWRITHHKSLFAQLCTRAKMMNPSVYLDEKLELLLGD
ncbi:MAG: hypothetical protein IKD72_00980 [Clostridia bacterium]|nr:hypothetical protein [Clostridia bacterium]